MSRNDTPHADDVPMTLAERWDRLCDQFERAWKSGTPRRIEDCLDEMPAPGKPALFRELLGLELVYRNAAGERPALDDYQARFPGLTDAIRDAFAPTEELAEAPTLRRMGEASAALHLLSGPASLWKDLIGPKLFSELRAPEASVTATTVSADDNGLGCRTISGGEEYVASDGTATEGNRDRRDDSTARRFRVLRPHARGGLGAVFVALDEELNREVAIKEIQDSFVKDPINRARFLAEAVITGNLEHPGVVPVYALGWRAGRPFYAMRFIRGESFKEAIDAFHRGAHTPADPGARFLALRKLSNRFISVCEAIAYAHSRGLLHRDLKPANIMLGKYGETLVIDWGLAVPLPHPAEPNKGQEEPPPLGAKRSPGLGSLVGTPAYMSPEQASGERERLSAASDIYSLGATLYCLLTGKAPFDGRDVATILQRVCVGDFPAPRQVDASIDRALDAICLKAMSLNPQARYSSANALAEDVERWLADEPVSAARAPLALRARRWARRHRTLVASALATLVVAVIGLSAVATVQSRANRDLKNANQEKSAALQETLRAKQATEKALEFSEQARQQKDAVLVFFKEKILWTARPEERQGGLGRTVTVRNAVNTAEPAIARLFENQPLVEAEVRGAIGETYFYLGELPLAVPQLKRALYLCEQHLSKSNVNTLMARNNLALAYKDAGRYADAIKLFEEALEQMTATLGASDPRTLTACNNLALAYQAVGRGDAAIRLLESTLAARERTLGRNHEATLGTRINLAATYLAAGRTTDAVRIHEETARQCERKLGADHLDTLAARSNLAKAYRAAGRIPDAVELCEQVLTARERKLSADDHQVLGSRNDLATAYLDAGRVADAIAMHEATLRLLEAKSGVDHPDTLTSRNNLATAYHDADRIAEAQSMHEQTLKQRLSRLGQDHPDTLMSRNNLATTYLDLNRTSEGMQLLEVTLEASERTLGSDHPFTLLTRSNLAAAYNRAGSPAKAARLHLETLKSRTTNLGPDHPDTLISRNNLAMAYWSAGRAEEAIALWSELKPDADRVFGPRHPSTIMFVASLASAQELLGRWAAAEPLRRELLENVRASRSRSEQTVATELNALGGNLLGQERWPEAEPLLREALVLRDKVIPDDFRRFNTMSLLGGVLVGEGRYAEAEPLVVSGYEGIKAREALIPRTVRTVVREAASRVIWLYEGWGKAELAASWKAKLGLADLPPNVFERP
jgi:eukaryotic-like serine/threonine-protein kinase